MTAQNRIPREVDTRALQERPKQWTQPDLLPEPDKQAGFAYRWIRVSTLNNADARNISKSLREGWEPVSIEEQPRLKLLASLDGPFKGSIEIGGLVLCKIPEEFMDQRREHYDRVTQNQTDSVDNSFMRQNDPRMPVFNERKSSTSFGKGK